MARPALSIDVAVPPDYSEAELQLFAGSQGRAGHSQEACLRRVRDHPRNHALGEIDHFYPLCASGSNDVTNLSFQPETNIWNGRNYGFYEKGVISVG